MNTAARLLNPSEAAAQLGISTKALRLYEERGLLTPVRTAAGWRAYDTAQMSRAADIVALRALRLSLAEVARVLDGDARLIEGILAAHARTLEARARESQAAAEKVQQMRVELARGHRPGAKQIAHAMRPARGICLSIDLPWPWNGERFEMRDVGCLNFIVGPLGSGKTRLAMKLAGALPRGRFVGLDRLEDGSAAAGAMREADPMLKARAEQSVAAVLDGGGAPSDALRTLLTLLEADGRADLVIDMPEQGLDGTTQEALISHLRRRASNEGVLFLLTRSDRILDLESVAPDESILLCPANHSPPIRVAPYRGAPGYEAVAMCLGSPQARARTEGVIAWRPSTSLVEADALLRSGKPSMGRSRA